MTDILAQLMADAGIDPSASKSSKAGKFFARAGVQSGPEYLRIRALPRRRWQDASDLEQLIELMTNWLRKPGTVTVPGSFDRLNAMQASALRELYDYRRVGVVANVGMGKSAVAALAPTVLGAKRPLFMTFKKLLSKSQRDFRILAENWRVATNYTFLSVESLSNKSGADFLERYAPDLVVVDECFAAQTEIETPDGPRPIESLKVGDRVLTPAGSEPVSATMQSFNSLLKVTIGSRELLVTENHPFLTQRGWVSAGALQRDDYCVRVLFDNSDRKAAEHRQSFLLSPVLDEMARFPTGLQAADAESEHSSESTEVSGKVLSGESRTRGRTASDVVRSYVLQESDARGFYSSENEANTFCDWASTEGAWWQRQRIDQSSNLHARAARRRLEGGVHSVDGRPGSPVALSESLQDRLSVRTNEDSYRDRRCITPSAESKRAGRPEDRVFGTHWLEAVSSIERLPGRHRVYNLEVSGSNTYVAEGVIVHNCHAFRSLKSTRTRRLQRYMEAHPNPECIFVPLTGTPGDTSVKDIAHIQAWVHGEQQAPLPQSWLELEQWAEALDANVLVRTAPGVLSSFADGSQDLDEVRRGVGRRVEETPGNIYARTDSAVQCSLYLDAVRLETVPQSLDDIFAYVREHEDEMPDGRILETAIERWKTFQTLGMGFVHVIDPPPPAEWRMARKQYHAFVREILAKNEPGLDQPMLVGDACARGTLDSGGLYESWKAIEPTFKIHSRIDWIDDSCLKLCADWAAKNHGLIWTPAPEFGLRLAKLTGLPFFHRQGIDAKSGILIDEYDGKTSAVVSVQANNAGRNLQDRWSKALFVAPSAKSDLLEQQIGRIHRQGQAADSVEIYFLLCSIENWESLQKARFSRAKFDTDFGQSEGNKLLQGDWIVPAPEEVVSWRGPRWQK